MEDGNVGSYSDHDVQRREIGRFSKRMLTLMLDLADVSKQCRFIKPLLLETPLLLDQKIWMSCCICSNDSMA